MKNLLLVALSLALVLGLGESFDFHETDLASEDSLWDLYESWRSHHTVSRDLDEKHRRFNVFKENVKHVHNTNKMDKPYKLKLNKFADMTIHEYRSTILNGTEIRHASRGNGTFMYENDGSVPPSVDWRKKGAVTPVKFQGLCASSWAFSTVAAVEGINQITTKKLVAFSEQELVDCVNKNQGCLGGSVDNAFEYIEQNGISTEESYPYEGYAGNCDSSQMSPAVSIDGHVDLPENNEKVLLKAVANQPVSVAIDAWEWDFMFYSEGVFTGQCGTELNHHVAVVGYGTTQDGTKYWIVKNSWGPYWGEKGYIRMLRGIRDKEGLCGIAMSASFPIILPTNPAALKHSPKDEL